MNAFAYWAFLQRASGIGRLDADAERARWRAMAHHYDRNALHSNAPEFARTVAALVRPGESVLEIGPGTGGFTIPVAERARRVVAIDLSEAMLAVLGEALAGQEIANVELRQGEWPDVEAGEFDIVLAVNSLYRILDVRACIERMTKAARRRVIVVWSAGHNPPVLPSIVDPLGPRAYRPGVSYMHLLLALHELGIVADLAMHRVPRAVWRASYNEAATGLLGVTDPTDVERTEARRLARTIFAPEGEGVVHRYEGQVAVICWDGGER